MQCISHCKIPVEYRKKSPTMIYWHIATQIYKVVYALQKQCLICVNKDRYSHLQELKGYCAQLFDTSTMKARWWDLFEVCVFNGSVNVAGKASRMF